MTVEIKVKVARIIDGKTRKRTETYIMERCEFFVTAEHMVNSALAEEQSLGTVESYEVLSLRQSSITEIATENPEELENHTFIATLCGIFLADDGTEKKLKYRVLLGADSLDDAYRKTGEFARQGYDMHIEGLKQVDYIYLGHGGNQNE